VALASLMQADPPPDAPVSAGADATISEIAARLAAGNRGPITVTDRLDGPAGSLDRQKPWETLAVRAWPDSQARRQHEMTARLSICVTRPIPPERDNPAEARPSSVSPTPTRRQVSVTSPSGDRWTCRFSIAACRSPWTSWTSHASSQRA
jgi:hypothetical protein